MRIESITAHAFGPIVGETLNFTPGMTVVIGDNESAKSSWHAAIYSALCGRRRGKGRGDKGEQRFSDLHRPWDCDQWLVSAVVGLDDGRRIELWQDLAGKVDCHATDLVLGRDVSDEVMNEGMPDAAKWLGLDRRSFLATACVNQAQLLGVVDKENANGLQRYLERSSATAGADATAKEALERIDEFRSSNVGVIDARSSKPLRRAIEGVNNSNRVFEQSRRSHEEYLRFVEEVDQLRHDADEAEDRVALYEAAEHFNKANELRERYLKVIELDRQLDGEPPRAAESESLFDAARQAVAIYRNSPGVTELTGPSSTDLEEQLACLPRMPDGPTAVAPDIERFYNRVLHTARELEIHERNKPIPPEQSLPSIGSDELLDLARNLEQHSSSVEPTLVAQMQGVTNEIHSLEVVRRRSSVMLAVGILVALAGVVGVALRAANIVLGGLLALVGVALVMMGTRNRQSGSLVRLRSRFSELQTQDNFARTEEKRFGQRHRDAEGRCQELGIAPDPDAIRHLVRQLASAADYTARLDDWLRRSKELKLDNTRADGDLREVLGSAGVIVEDDVLEAYSRYGSQCEERAKLAKEAGRRFGLEEQLQNRKRFEEMAARTADLRKGAEDRLLEVARACTFTPISPEDALAKLVDWQRKRREEFEDLEVRRQQWAELNALLGGRTISDLLEEVVRMDKQVQSLLSQVDVVEVSEIARQDLSALLPRSREVARTALSTFHSAEGELKEMARRLPSVSVAEESLASAKSELSRVRNLDETLGLTTQFLKSAQERVQRDVAPVLASTLVNWLPRVTAGRYIDVTVDPAKLVVSVCGSSRRWRRAEQLSHGTSEQIYLLLRATLAQHLTGSNGICPLLLDDVTVHADVSRTIAILDLLHELSRTCQVILFSQESTVAEWGRLNLREPTDSMVELAVVGVP